MTDSGPILRALRVLHGGRPSPGGRRAGAARAALLLALGAAAASAADQPEMTALPALVPLAGPGPVPAAPWHVEGLPGQRKPYTRFEVVPLDGERVLRVDADRSYGNLVHAVQLGAGGPHRLSWRWRVDVPVKGADLHERHAEDMPVRLCAMFDLPLAALPFVERQILRAVRLNSREDLPAATVCYVWDSNLPPGSVAVSPFTRRIRYVVLRGPESPLHAWRKEQRDIDQDFLHLFADEAKTVPPLMGVAVGGDADNTQGHGVSHVADLELH